MFLALGCRSRTGSLFTCARITSPPATRQLISTKAPEPQSETQHTDAEEKTPGSQLRLLRLPKWDIKPVDKALVPSTRVLDAPQHARPLVRWTQEEKDQFDGLLTKYVLQRREPGGINWALARRTQGPLQHDIPGPQGGLFDENSGFQFEQNLSLANQKMRKVTRWSTTEDDALRTAVDIYGPHKWRLIADFVGTRNFLQCVTAPLLHWARLAQRRARLNGLLGNVSSQNGIVERRSSVVAALLSQQQEQLSERSKKQASHTLDNWLLDGRVLILPFTPKEDEALLRLVRTYGSRHKGEGRGATVVQARTAAIVKKRYYELIRKYSEKTASCTEQNSTAVGESGESVGEGALPWWSAKRSRRKPGDRTAKRAIRRWSEEESAALKTIIEEMIQGEHGFISWAEVSRRMGSYNRSASQCLVYWSHNNGTHLKRTPFTLAEDKLIWPFVVDQQQRPISSRYMSSYRGRRITTNYDEGDGRMPLVVGIGWLSTGPMAGRPTGMVRERVRRLQLVIEWLRVVAGVKDAGSHIELVSKLADSPSKFRISNLHSQQINNYYLF
ncbi:hypothetical protein BX661DRAFT_183698, partial [Kickxella alabastrina]|uniref:uncharacterized protein n=1 Tax=Kickxella alabastrina TaxID=61397 RepID=UPI0022203146